MSEKITERHLHRRAIVYVRQSTPHQVQHHDESRRLQYAMRERVIALGWRDIEVIDDDQGRSAGGSVDRAGFHRLVAAVSLGEVGAVAAREVSRFARNSRDWQRLVEVCRLVDTLLIDQETVYDARRSDDRLLLGLKGTLNEYELDLLRLRALEARRAQARRGEYLASVAVGYRKSEAGRLEMTPDLRVQQVLRTVFAKALELGSGRRCMLWLRDHGLEVPSNTDAHGTVRWRAASYIWVLNVLRNPIYAGAYAYGRMAAETAIEAGVPCRRIRRQPRERWVLLRDHHAAYIDWETFERVQAMLMRNAQNQWTAAPGAAKRGAALLAGLLRCRRCGRKPSVAYSGRQRAVRYQCRSVWTEFGDPRCLSFSALDVEARVVDAVLEIVRPGALEAARAAAAAEGVAATPAVDAVRLQLEGARYAAERAFRQYDAADPENRLVAAELERRWNAALGEVREVEGRLAAAERTLPAAAEPPSAAELLALATELPTVWHAPTTDVRLKKRLLRTLIEEILVDVDEAASQIVVLIHWQGGLHSELLIPKRRSGAHRVQTPADVVAAVRGLALVCADGQIAKWLNGAGLRTARGLPWSRDLVASVRHQHGIAVFHKERRNAEGWLTLSAAARLVGLADLTVKRAVARGIVSAQRPLPGGPWILQRDELLRSEIRARLKPSGAQPTAEAGAPSEDQLILDISPT